MSEAGEKIYLGVDWGQERIGLALGYEEIKMASPFGVVHNLDELLKIVEKEGVDMIILGQPIKMSGERDRLDSRFLKFAETLQERSGLPVELVDERLTSKAADALSISAKKKVARDAVAAMLILQAYLDKI